LLTLEKIIVMAVEDTSASAAEQNRPLGRKMRALTAALSVALLVTLAVLQFYQFRTERLLKSRIELSYATEIQLQRVLSLQQDVETGGRGYLLTGQAQFLQPFVAAEARAEETLAELSRLLSGSEAKRNRSELLNALTRQKIDHSKRLIEIRRTGDVEEAGRHVAEGRGKAITDRTRGIIDQLLKEERSELLRLENEAGKTRARLLSLSIGIELALVGLVVLAFMAYLRNMRRIARLSDEARRQSRLESTIFEAATDAMLLMDESYCIKRVNRSAEKLFGISRADLRGKPVFLLFVGEDGNGPIETALQSSPDSDSRESKLFDVQGHRSDGAIFDAEVAISPIDLDMGTYHLVAVRDASERRRVERMKDEFVSTVSHELRTPLTSITASLGLIAGGAVKLDDQSAKLVRIALNNSQRLVRLISNILDVEKIGSGKFDFDTQILPLRMVVEDAIAAMSGFASEANVAISLQDGGENNFVAADHDRIVQVLTNLISNAVKFSPAGSSVTIRIESGDAQHRVTIRDYGPGIAPEFRHRIFDRFAQAGGADSRKKGGTGLGLAIAKEIVTRTGGTIGYESSAQGSEFFITIPSAKPLDSRPRARVR
jgi:PAS domain S-box-containing protein